MSTNCHNSRPDPSGASGKCANNIAVTCLVVFLQGVCYASSVVEGGQAKAETEISGPAPITERIASGVALMEQASWDRAIQSFSDIVSNYPAEADVYTYRGGCYSALGDWDKAIEDFSKVISLQQTNEIAYLNRANAFRANRKLTNALLDFDKCLALKPNNPAARFGRASVYDEQGEYGLAITDLNAGLLEDPTDDGAFCVRAHVNYMTGEFDRAIKDYHDALRLNSSNACAYNGLAWLKASCSKRSIRDGDEAVKLAKKACGLTKWSNWKYIDTLAAAFAENQDYEQAAKYEERALNAPEVTTDDKQQMLERLASYKKSMK